MIPKFLDENSTISIVAPSFGCSNRKYKTRLKTSIENFKKEISNVNIGPNCFINKGVAASADPKERAREVMDAFTSNSDAIISAGGGEVMSQILEYIDFEIIKKNPKWFVGFSDNTNLTYTITVNTEIETIYGTNAPGYYNYPFEYDSLDTWEMLKGKNVFYSYKEWQYKSSTKILAPYKFDMKTKIFKYNYKNPFEGRLIGGCLDCLAGLCGTKADNTINYIEKNKDEGIIFFLEACDYNSVGIIRALTQLKNSGWFKYVKGFVIGRSMHFNDRSFGVTPRKAYLEVLKDFNVPILLDVSLGHLDPSMPMRCGAYAKISIEKNNIKIEY